MFSAAKGGKLINSSNQIEIWWKSHWSGFGFGLSTSVSPFAPSASWADVYTISGYWVRVVVVFALLMMVFHAVYFMIVVKQQIEYELIWFFLLVSAHIYRILMSFINGGH